MTDATFRTNVPFNARSVDVQFGSRITKVSLFRIDQSSEDRRIKIDRSNCSKMTKKKLKKETNFTFTFLSNKGKTIAVTSKGKDWPVTSKGCNQDFASVR